MDYEKIGFKCGIEIHQQIDGEKLFCKCPTEIRKDNPHFEVIRKLRASAGESGAVDQAASHEAKKSKYFSYQGYEDTTCLVEVDEEPPREINANALQTTLEVAKMLNCHIIDEIQFMRKTVIDGSNTSGFQRTALVGINGWVEVDGRKFGIESVCLEEEACQVIKRTENYDVYNLSRLGIPLIEIATSPDMKNAVEAEEVAGKIGMVLRSTGKMKRGIGSIRQDVNISIKGRARVEIKGFQDLKSIPKVIENEVKRHLELEEKGEELLAHVRKAESDWSTSFLRPMPGADRMYPETDVPRITPDLSDVKTHKLLDEQIAEWQEKYEIPEDYAKQMAKKGIAFDEVVSKHPTVSTTLLAKSLTSSVVELRRKFDKELTLLEVEPIFSELTKGSISESSVFPAMEKFAETGDYSFDSFKSVSDDELRAEIEKIMAANKGAPMGALMGQVMAKFRGKADGKKVSELIKELS